MGDWEELGSGQEEKMSRMEAVSAKMLDKISLAIDQLDIQVAREVRKEKEVILLCAKIYRKQRETILANQYG